MISRIVVASMLAASSVSGSAQQGVRSADGAKAYWPHMHQCTLEPVSNFTVTNMGGMSTGRAISGSAVWTGPVSRIDLQVTGAPGGSPMISAHAINTKGTGTSSGRSINEIGIAVKSKRMSSGQSPVGVACVTSEVTGDAEAQKASMVDFHFTNRDSKSVGWSCSVSGSEEAPVFSVGLLVPTTLGQAERVVYTANVGTGHSGVSIVPRGTAPPGSESFACASKEPRNVSYDLAQMKKA